MVTIFAEEGEEGPRIPDPEDPTWDACDFFVGQLEMCPDTGRLHYQCYMELSRAVRLTTLKTWVGLERAHFEARRGTQQQAIDYCTKEDTRVEDPITHGEPKQQGARNDLVRVREMLDEGRPLVEIARENFSAFVRYERGFRSYARLIATRRDWPMEILVLVGPSGTGKTRRARELAAEQTSFWKNKSNWWDGYEGQHTVVWDEFYGACCSFSELLQILDRYPYSVPVKGSTVEFTSRRIIFTSNQEPQDWYDAERTHQGPWADNPLHRRLTEFGTIVRTGEVHRAAPRVIELFDGYNAPFDASQANNNAPDDADYVPPTQIIELE